LTLNGLYVLIYNTKIYNAHMWSSIEHESEARSMNRSHEETTHSSSDDLPVLFMFFTRI